MRYIIIIIVIISSLRGELYASIYFDKSIVPQSVRRTCITVRRVGVEVRSGVKSQKKVRKTGPLRFGGIKDDFRYAAVGMERPMKGGGRCY